MDYIEFESYLSDLVHTLDKVLEEDCGHRIGFALFCFEFNKPGISNYISNANRNDMIEALEETLKRFKNDEVMPAVIPEKQ